MANELILIVEDNAVNRNLVRKVLQRVGFRTAEAVSGEEAVAIARAQGPDLVLMDYQLPDIDGIETFRRIRADTAIRYMPIIAVTASAMPEDIVKMQRSGFDGIETKPINVKGLLATIEKLLVKRKEKS